MQALGCRARFLLGWQPAVGRALAFAALGVLGALGCSQEERTPADADIVSPGARRNVLAAAQWTTPRHIEEIEWFANANELCTLMAALDQRAEQPCLEPISSVLTANPGLPIDPVQFPHVAYKGGSEPGVLHLDWLVHAASGARYFVSVGLNDATAPISDEAAALRTALGIFDLLATEP